MQACIMLAALAALVFGSESVIAAAVFVGGAAIGSVMVSFRGKAVSWVFTVIAAVGFAAFLPLIGRGGVAAGVTVAVLAVAAGYFGGTDGAASILFWAGAVLFVVSLFTGGKGPLPDELPAVSQSEVLLWISAACAGAAVSRFPGADLSRMLVGSAAGGVLGVLTVYSGGIAREALVSCSVFAAASALCTVIFGVRRAYTQHGDDG